MTEIAAGLEQSGRIRLVLVAYGVALAVVGTTAWIVAIPDSHVSLQMSRQTAIEHGYPPRRAIVLVAILAGCIVAAAIRTQLFAAQVADRSGRDHAGARAPHRAARRRH